jgi:hypothetical protein
MLRAWNVSSTCPPIEQELAEQVPAPASRPCFGGFDRERSTAEERPRPPITLSPSIVSWRLKMKTESLHDLHLEQLKDLYDAENQWIKALPKNGKGSFFETIAQRFRGVP